MSLYLAPWNEELEPTSGNVRIWLDSIYSKFQPIEQSRWNQANIDTLFYAGNQSFINRNFTFSPGISPQQYYFNLVQQPVNMVTGRQRQRRKQILYQPTEGSDGQTTDQYTKLISEVCQKGGVHETFSKSCELSAVAGLNLLQPYLDFTGDDPAQGQMKVKVWEYNSFLVDPYFRQPDMSDAQFVWCQEYISKHEALERFPGKIDVVGPMYGTPQRYGQFYFLPENYNMARNDLMVLSYVWYKWKKKKKRLYSHSRNQFFDFASEENLEQILYHVDDMEVVTVDSPCWKVVVVLNETMMFHGENPLWDGSDCPFIPNYWNYEPHMNQFDIRSRSLVFPMRSPQFLFNYKVIQNNDIAAATINAGWKRKVGAVANEDNLKKSGQGWDIIINPGFELTDCEKIIPSAVPESDLALAQQMDDLIWKVAGVNIENWSGQNDKQISSLTMLLKQDANLMVFQKYFDQWDQALKLLGERMLQIAIKNWNAARVQTMIGEDPSPFFYSRLFAKYKTVVEEGELTPTQSNLQASQMMDINAAFQREVFPPSMIIPKMNITGKGEIVPYLQQQEQQQAAAQNEMMNIQHTVEEMKLKELMAKIHNQLSQARERDSRSASNAGLFEERISEISKNHAISTREKMDALTKMLEAIQKFGEVETFLQANNLESIKWDEEETEKKARTDIERSQLSKNFVEQLMQSQPMRPQQQQNPMAMNGR